MRAYIDTGTFIDYLIGRGHAGPYLRSADRRGRDPAQLGKDAEAVLLQLSSGHSACTSALTCYEIEEAMYQELARSAAGVAHGRRYIIPSARAVMTQMLMTIDLFHVDLLDLTSGIVHTQGANLELQKRGVRAADALHITTALSAGADLVISADSDVLALDQVLVCGSGSSLRCVDTDTALGLLP